MSGNTHSLCPLDFAQKCCQNAGIMPFQRHKFQIFPAGHAPGPPRGTRLTARIYPPPRNVHILRTRLYVPRAYIPRMYLDKCLRSRQSTLTNNFIYMAVNPKALYMYLQDKKNEN